MYLLTWFLFLTKLRMAALAKEDYCKEGTYGNNCELKCPDQCRPFQTFPCDKITGQCSEGCNNGYYGDQCDKQCPCPSGICYQQTGDCFGTVPATATATLNVTDKITDTTAGVAAGWRTTAIILIVFIMFLVCGGVMMFLYVRFKQMKITLTDTWKIIFSKAADADVSVVKEKRTQTVAMPKEGEALIRGRKGQIDGSQPLGEHYLCCFCPSDQAEEMTQVFKGPTEVEELRRENQRLKDERDRIEAKCEEMKKHIACLEIQDKENQRLLGDQAEEMTQVFKGSTEVEELRRENQRLKDEDKENQRLLGLPINSKNHLMENDKWLQCPNLKFDKETVNVKVGTIDGNMVLWNTPHTGSRGNNVKRFQNFHGSTCTKPLVKSGFYQYFEAVFDIHLKQPIEEGELVMQLVFCREKDRDKSPYFEIGKKCFLVEVANCNKRNKLCLVSNNNGKTEQIQELMDNVKGSYQRVMIGIRLDKYMKQIKVYHGLELNVLHKTDINIGDEIWPMFGVCDERNASVSVQLKVGDDIRMEKEKKQTLKSKHM